MMSKSAYPPQTPPPKNKPYLLMLRPANHDRLRTEATEQHRSMSAQLNFILEERYSKSAAEK